MRTQTRSEGRTKAFAWLAALMVLVFMTSACGQTNTAPEDNADDAPPANNAPEEDAPAENQGDDQDDQGEDQADDQDNDQADDQSDDQDNDQDNDQDDDQDDN